MQHNTIEQLVVCRLNHHVHLLAEAIEKEEEILPQAFKTQGNLVTF